MADASSQPRRITVVLELDAEPPAMWCVSSPDVRGLNTQGRTIASALEMAADAVRGLGRDLRADEIGVLDRAG